MTKLSDEACEFAYLAVVAFLILAFNLIGLIVQIDIDTADELYVYLLVAGLFCVVNLAASAFVKWRSAACMHMALMGLAWGHIATLFQLLRVTE